MPFDKHTTRLKKMEETNKTTQKALGIKNKDWMTSHATQQIVTPKRKRQPSDQTTLKSKMHKSENKDPKKAAPTVDSAASSNTRVTQTQQSAGSSSVSAVSLDQSSRLRTTHELDSDATIIDSSVEDLDQSILTEKPPSSQLIPTSLQHSSSINVSVNSKQNDIDDSIPRSLQTANSTNCGRATAETVSQQSLTCLTPITVLEDDCTLENSQAPDKFSPANKPQTSPHASCDSVPAPTLTSPLVMQSLKTLPPLVVACNSQGKRKLPSGPEGEDRCDRLEKNPRINRSTTNSSQNRSLAQRHAPILQRTTTEVATSTLGVTAPSRNGFFCTTPSQPSTRPGLTWQPVLISPPAGSMLTSNMPSHIYNSQPTTISGQERSMAVCVNRARSITSTNDSTLSPRYVRQKSISEASGPAQIPQAPLSSSRNMSTSPQFPPGWSNTSSSMSSISQQHNSQSRHQAILIQLGYRTPETPLTLCGLINASGPDADVMWNSMYARILRDFDDINKSMDQSIAGNDRLQWLTDLKTACVHRDSRYLAMLQTFANLRMPFSKNFMFDAALSRGLHYLGYLFGDIDETITSRFINFPCICQPDQDFLCQWLGTIHRDIQIIGLHMDHLVQAVLKEERLLVMNDVDTLFGDSVCLQITAIRSLLVNHWKIPKDERLSEIMKRFGTGLYEKRRIQMTSPANAYPQMLNVLRKDVNAGIKACYRAHKKWRISTSKPVAPSSTSVSPHNVNSHPPEARVIPQFKDYRGPTQPIPGFTPDLVTNSHGLPFRTQTPTVRMPPQIPLELQTSTIAQGIPSQCISVAKLGQQHSSDVPSPSIHSHWTNKEITAFIMRKGNPSAPLTLAFPLEQRISHVSEYDPPLHHAHLREPTTIQTSLQSENDNHRACIVDYFATKPLAFKRTDSIRKMEFVVSEADFAKLPRESVDVAGSPSRRNIEATSMIIRLRGALGRPKTMSEWYIAETHWPTSIAILLNNKAIEFRRKPQYPKDLAVDVTSYLRQGNNHLVVSFLWLEQPSVDFQYLLAVERVMMADIKSVKANVEAGKRSSTEEQLKQYFQQPLADEVEMMLDHLDVSLLDPYTSKMPNTPARSIYCTHFQCFDLDIFLESRPKDVNKPDQWICPICGKDARPGKLQLDDWMKQVLQKLRDDNQKGAKAIKVLPDLTWTVKEEPQIEKTSQRGNLITPSNISSKEREIIEID